MKVKQQGERERGKEYSLAFYFSMCAMTMMPVFFFCILLHQEVACYATTTLKCEREKEMK
jgi:hypothetical protein